MARLLGVLAHARADTPEGRTAAGLAAKIQRRWGFTEAAIEHAAAEARADARLQVDLDGYGAAPWLTALAALVAQAHGVTLGLNPGPRLAFVGAGAGRAHRRLVSLRTRVEDRAARLGADSIRRLAWGQRISHGGWFTISTGSAQTIMVGASRDLGQYGERAIDVYRLAVAKRILGPEIRERAKAAAAERARSREPAPEQTAPPSPGPAPPPGTPAPRQQPDPEAAALAAFLERVRELVNVAEQVAQAGPAWIEEPPAPATEAALIVA